MKNLKIFFALLLCTVTVDSDTNLGPVKMNILKVISFKNHLFYSGSSGAAN